VRRSRTGLLTIPVTITVLLTLISPAGMARRRGPVSARNPDANWPMYNRDLAARLLHHIQLRALGNITGDCTGLIMPSIVTS
jgi:hypothetical protein